MHIKKPAMLLVGALLCGPSSLAVAETDVAAELDALKSQIANLRADNAKMGAELNQLRSSQQDNWLNERRKEEVKSLVRDVLADADTRASLAGEGMTAGHNGKHFFLASGDGTFLLEIDGQVAARYIFNAADQKDASDEDVGGFQMRRVKLGFGGHVLTPKFTYLIKSAFDRKSGALVLEEAWSEYAFADAWSIVLGQFKEPLLREFMMSSARIHAVERSSVIQYFSGEFTQGLMLKYSSDVLRGYGALTAGPGKANTDFTDNKYDYDLVGRAEVCLAGKFGEFGTYEAWTGEPFGVVLGGGASYVHGAEGMGVHKVDMIKYTADVIMKAPSTGTSAYVGFMGQHIDDNGDPTASPDDNIDQLGVVAQVAQFIIPDKLDIYTRYEYADLDGSVGSNSGGTAGLVGPDDSNRLQLITVGGNYYFHKHDCKLTIDVVYGISQIPTFESTSTGLLPDADKGQVAIRGQFQFLF
jgi:Phosphate-selective porin O and P